MNDYAAEILLEQHARLQGEASDAEDRTNSAAKRHADLVKKLHSVRDALFALGVDPDTAEEVRLPAPDAPELAP